MANGVNPITIAEVGIFGCLLTPFLSSAMQMDPITSSKIVHKLFILLFWESIARNIVYIDFLAIYQNFRSDI